MPVIDGGKLRRIDELMLDGFISASPRVLWNNHIYSPT